MKSETENLRQRIEGFRKVCWDVESQSEAYLRDVANWEAIYFTRRISIWVTYALRNTRVTPDQVTASWVVLGVVGAGLLSTDEYWLNVLGVVLLFCSWILDNVDGELARWKQHFSVTGNLLDMVGHEVIFPLVFGGLTTAVWRQGGPPAAVVLGIVATALVTPLTKMQENVKLLLCLRALSRGDSLGTSDTDDSSRPDGPSRSGIKGVASQIGGVVFAHPGMLYLLAVAVIADRPLLYLLVYGVGIPLVFAPKYLLRARELRRMADDPRSLRPLIRPEWLDGKVAPSCDDAATGVETGRRLKPPG